MQLEKILDFLPLALGGGWALTWLTLKQKIKGMDLDNESKAVANLIAAMQGLREQMKLQDAEYRELKAEFVTKCALMQTEIDGLKKKLSNLSD